VANFAPTSRPRQNTLRTGVDDLVMFTPQFGAALPTATSATAIQVILDARGRVTSIGPPGGPCRRGTAIQASSTPATSTATP
jgi:hypothetical protein